jgi:hypothetical protein
MKWIYNGKYEINIYNGKYEMNISFNPTTDQCYDTKQ